MGSWFDKPTRDEVDVRYMTTTSLVRMTRAERADFQTRLEMFLRRKKRLATRRELKTGRPLEFYMVVCGGCGRRQHWAVVAEVRCCGHCRRKLWPDEVWVGAYAYLRLTADFDGFNTMLRSA